VPWPEDLAERYRREGYWRSERLGDLVRYWARTNGSRVALVAGDRSISYSELDLQIDRLASGLHRRGLRQGDRVVVQLPNIPEFVYVSMALFRLGAAPVFALPSHRSSEVRYLCDCSGARAYVIPDTYQGFDYREMAAQVRKTVGSLEHVLVVGRPGAFTALSDVLGDPVDCVGPSPGDVAFLLLSGGTVGLPKLIPRTHDDYSYQLRATAEALGVDRQSTYLAVLPIAHNAALGCPGVLGTLRVGGRVILCSSPNPSDVFPLIERESVTLTTLITPLVLLWLEAAELFGSYFPDLLLQIGGAMLDREAGWRVRPTLGCALTHWFGMAEGLLCHTRLDDPEDVIIGTQGRPLSAADELRVVDEFENDVQAGEIGQLLTRGPYTLRGYYNAPQYNATAFSPDGYLRTGDLVRITAQGNLVVEGRIKNVINRGGEKVSVEELEGHLLTHPAILRAAVVGIPDSFLGERTCAFVVAGESSLTLDEVRRFLSQRGLADYKMPDRLKIVAALPETGVAKINRAALRESIRLEISGHEAGPGQ